jgi:hypothetical protein
MKRETDEIVLALSSKLYTLVHSGRSGAKALTDLVRDRMTAHSARSGEQLGAP